jgi:hypothetical protein
MRPAVLIFLLAAALSAQEAGIEGVVVNKLTGQPLSGVRIHILTGDFTGNSGVEAAYGAVSDQAGHYAVTGMKPGLYLLLLEHPGFVDAPAEGAVPFSMTQLKPGQRLTDDKLEMTPRAVIAGRVVDEYGDPVQRVNVMLEAADSGRPPSNPFGTTNGTSDDRGEFRIVTAPGKYYIQARTFYGSGGPVEIRTDGTAPLSTGTTYYPSAANKSAAAVVEVTPGQDLAGLEIRLVRNAGAGPGGRGSTISGVVNGIPNGQYATIMLRSGEEGSGYNGRTGTTQDGKFSISGLEPGSYSVYAATTSGSPLQSQIVDVRLGGSDSPNVQLTLAPGPELTGTLDLAGMPPAAKRTVRLEAASGYYPFGAEMSGGDLDSNGAFRIANVSPGKYHVRVEPLPENAYVKSVLVDGVAAENGVIDFSRGVKGNRIKVTVSPNGGNISGKVIDKNGELVTGSLVMVILTTGAKQMQEENTQRITDGKYTFKAVRPGKYHLIALDIFRLAVFMNSGSQDEAMQSLIAAGEEIEIKEGDRIVKDLIVIDKMPGKEAPNAK